MRLRAMTMEDIPGGLRLCRAGGWNQLEEDWRLFIDSPGSGGLLIAGTGNVLGTAAYMRYDAPAWIAMMLVDPAERRAGLGAQLLTEALAALANASCVGLDATPAGEPLYRRFLEIGGGCERTPLCAYVPSRPYPPGDSRAAIRHMRPGVRLTGERVRSARGNRSRSRLRSGPRCKNPRRDRQGADASAFRRCAERRRELAE